MSEITKPIVLSIRLPADVQNTDKAIEMLGGSDCLADIVHGIEARVRKAQNRGRAGNW